MHRRTLAAFFGGDDVSVACSVPPPGCRPPPTQLRIALSHVNGRDRISLGSSRRLRVILIRHTAGAGVLTGGGPPAWTEVEKRGLG